MKYRIIALLLVLACLASGNVKAVSFLDFVYTGTDASKEWIGRGLVEALSMNLHSQREMSVMPTVQMGLHRQNHKRGNKPADIYSFGDFLDQDYLISSEYNLEKDTLSILMNIWNIRKQSLSSVGIKFHNKNIFEMTTSLTKEIYGVVYSDTSVAPVPFSIPEVDEKVFSIYAMAISHEAAGRIPEALYACERALELSPRFLEARLLLINLRLKAAQYGLALKLSKDLYKKYPQECRAIAIYGRALAMSGKSAQAVSFLKLHRSVCAESPYFTDALGRAYLDEGFYVIAVSLLIKTITMRPGISELYFLMGKAYYESEEYQKAVKALEKTVSLEPGNALYRCHLAMASRDAGDKIKAIRILENLNEERKDYLPAALQLSATYNELGWSKKALQSLQKSIRDNPDNGELLSGLGVTYLLMGMFKDADETFEKALKLNPKSSMVLNNAGVSALERKRYSDAVKYLARALKIEKRNPGISYNLAAAYFNLNKPSPAEKYLNVTLESSPKHLEARLLMADIKMKRGDIDGELSILAEIISLDPQNYDIKVRYARLLSAKGHYDAAVNVIEDVVKNNPGNHDYFAFLIDLYKLINWYDIAILKLDNMLAKNAQNNYAAGQLGEIIVRKMAESGRYVKPDNPDALKAIYLLKQAYNGNPEDVQSAYWYAKALIDFKKDEAEAKELLLKCVRKGLPDKLQKDAELLLKKK